MWTVWPAFLVAGVAEVVVFVAVDPAEIRVAGAPLELSRQAIHTLAFFGFWAVGIASSALTLLLEPRHRGGRPGPEDPDEPEHPQAAGADLPRPERRGGGPVSSSGRSAPSGRPRRGS